MTIRFVTLGCKLNFAESSAIGKTLLERGHVRARANEEADVCVVNTCSVTDVADHKGRQAIHKIRRENPNAVLIVTGCYAQLKPQEIKEIKGVDYVLGQDAKFKIPELVEQIERERERIASLSNDNEGGTPVMIDDASRVVPQASSPKQSIVPPEFTTDIRAVDDFHGAYSRDDRTRCFLKVQDGCNYFCTYCTIPLARGKSRNPSIAEVVTAAQQAIDEGAKEIVLTGVNIGDFGRSTGEPFIDLLRSLDALQAREEGVGYRVRISSCEPNLLSDEVIDFVAQSKHFAPHFHIPLQSGSNEVLRIMHRRYTRELFAERVTHIRQVMPNAFIGVDCMVGVRGETAEYFADYVAFIERLPVSQLHVFTYSERANTRMLEMDLEVVSMAERHRRSKVLHAISEQKLADFYALHKGEKAVVLWESKREGDKMSGFTENYIRVTTPYDKKKVNTFEEIVL